MALSAAGATVIAAGINATQHAFNGISTGIRNRKSYKYTRQINKELYDYQRERDAMANKYNREMAELAYSQNLSQWNRENAYNHPSAQMARYREAGLNPNLIYSQQNLSASSPSIQYPSADFASAPNLHIPDVETVRLDNLSNIGNILMNYQSLRSQQLDNDIKEVTKDDAIADSYNRVMLGKYQSEIGYYETLATFKDLLEKYGKDKLIPFYMDGRNHDGLQSRQQELTHKRNGILMFTPDEYQTIINDGKKDMHQYNYETHQKGFTLSEYMAEHEKTRSAREKAQLAGDDFLAEVYKAKASILNRLVQRDKDGNVKFTTLLNPDLHNELKTLDMILNNSSLYDSAGDVLGILSKLLIKK